jgi:hypothetical protein
MTGSIHRAFGSPTRDAEYGTGHENITFLWKLNVRKGGLHLKGDERIPNFEPSAAQGLLVRSRPVSCGGYVPTTNTCYRCVLFKGPTF